MQTLYRFIIALFWPRVVVPEASLHSGLCALEDQLFGGLPFRFYKRIMAPSISVLHVAVVEGVGS
jgi:hypothetical protein